MAEVEVIMEEELPGQEIMEEEVGKLCMQLDAEDMVDGWVLLLDSGGGSSRLVD